MWKLGFISEDDFTKHVAATIAQYDKKLLPINIEKFNSNIVDPVKMIFDKNVYQYSWDELIQNEIFRQNDTMYIFSFNTINGSNFKCLHIWMG